MPEGNETDREFREEPDRIPDAREEDIMAGDRRLSRPDSSLPDWEMPDAAYRPVPIVWFFTAWLVQVFGMGLIYALVSNYSSLIALAFCLLLTGLIGMWTWDRGMKSAGKGWKAATIIMLAFQLGYVALITSASL